mgnify:CR=1 FL=1
MAFHPPPSIVDEPPASDGDWTGIQQRPQGGAAPGRRGPTVSVGGGAASSAATIRRPTCASELPRCRAAARATTLEDRIRLVAWPILLSCFPPEAELPFAPERLMQQRQYAAFGAMFCGRLDATDNPDVDRRKIDADVPRTMRSLHFFSNDQPTPQDETERGPGGHGEGRAASHAAGAASRPSPATTAPPTYTTNQMALRRALHIFVGLNPGVGYVQGMNEIMGLLLVVFSGDGRRQAGLEEEADAFFCFQAILKEIRDYYCRALDDDVSTGLTSAFQRFTAMLFVLDDALAAHLQRIELVPAYYVMRWVTLMFAQEFDVPDTIVIWDFVLSFCPEGKMIDILLTFAVTMVISVRESLLQMDFPTAMTFLQAYPRTIDVRMLIRAAAKNFDDVLGVTPAADASSTQFGSVSSAATAFASKSLQLASQATERGRQWLVTAFAGGSS